MMCPEFTLQRGFGHVSLGRLRVYDWRKMTDEERAETLARRQSAHRPWHSVPHRFRVGHRRYIITGACYEHAEIVGFSDARMDETADVLCEIGTAHGTRLYAWCVLPNHYHVVVDTDKVEGLLKLLALMHGRSSYRWNLEERCAGRRVWCNDVEREIRSDAHLWASINYVHHNPVKHRYAKRWQEWPWSSATRYLEGMGRERAREIWEAYPVFGMGAGWDEDTGADGHAEA